MTSIRTEHVAAFLTLTLAGVCWVVLLAQAPMMMMGPALIVVMMAAMMLPSAAPFAWSLTREAGRPATTAVALAIYLATWAVIGVALLAVTNALHISVVLAVAFAIVWTLTPFARAGRARCKSLAAAGGGSLRAGFLEGAGYSAGCIACSAGVMVPLFVLGMSDLRLMAAGAALVLVLKLV
jgi:hypothetical protein